MMNEVTSNGPDLYAQLAHRMRTALAEFNDDNKGLETLVSELVAYKRAHLAAESAISEANILLENTRG